VNSKYMRHSYYVVRIHPGGQLISRHWKLKNARLAARKSSAYRVYNQDGRTFA